MATSHQSHHYLRSQSPSQHNTVSARPKTKQNRKLKKENVDQESHYLKKEKDNNNVTLKHSIETPETELPSKKETKFSPTSQFDNIREEKEDKEEVILEEGIIYFCFRPKVEHETAEDLDDVQRSYIVLRLGVPKELTDENTGNEHCRLLLVPKKTFTAPNNRFL